LSQISADLGIPCESEITQVGISSDSRYTDSVTRRIPPVAGSFCRVEGSVLVHIVITYAAAWRCPLCNILRKQRDCMVWMS